MTKDEALDLALDALDNLLYWDNGKSDYDQAREAITAIKQARSAPVQVFDHVNAARQGLRDAQNRSRQISNLINCGTCGYPLAPEERTSLIERDGVMVKPAPVQEPVAWMDVDENGAMSSLRYWSEPDNRYEVALYPAPPAAVVNQQLTTEPAAPLQEPPPECQTEAEKRAYAFGWWKALEANRAAPVQERNFCERCGKRLGDYIHTCTPPATKEKNT